MKYLILKINGVPSPILFPEHIQHIDVARGIMSRIKAFNTPFVEVEQTSAGFLETDAIAVQVGGSSQSLMLTSHPEDAATILAELTRESLGFPKQSPEQISVLKG